MKSIVSVNKVSKLYHLGGTAPGYSTLRESISAGAARHWNRLRNVLALNRASSRSSQSTLWALKDVSFDVKEGEVVGLIGRNGAGKSTLLKILSRITAPTAGEVALRGRVGSLLEVGTGFHPELTGRENIYLNGAILGMPRREIARKFDEIVAFAEIETFLDTPVKRYSSGMYTRLAFAVASHLEPEVLVVDEVLAVGDAAFQRKCLGKMNEISKQGRTVLFVSHNMAAIKSLCTRALLIDGGRVMLDGHVDDVVNQYLAESSEMSRTGIIPADVPRITSGEAKMSSAAVIDADGRPTSQIFFRQPIKVALTCEIVRDIPDGLFEVSISDMEGVHVVCCTTTDGAGAPKHLARGHHSVEVLIENILLPRSYTLDVGIHHYDGRTADFVQRAFNFTVMKINQRGSDHFRWSTVRGFVRSSAKWSSDFLSNVAEAG